jgi:hypothetical protein
MSFAPLHLPRRFSSPLISFLRGMGGSPMSYGVQNTGVVATSPRKEWQAADGLSLIFDGSTPLSLLFGGPGGLDFVGRQLAEADVAVGGLGHVGREAERLAGC